MRPGPERFVTRVRVRLHPRGLGAAVGITGVLLASTAFVSYGRAPTIQLLTDEETPRWAVELYEHHLPAISWASARVAMGERRGLIKEAFEPVWVTGTPPEIARVLEELERRLRRPGLDPRQVRELLHALNLAAQKLGLPLYADVQLEPASSKSAKWVVWIKTYRIAAVRTVAAEGTDHTVFWLDRLDQLGVVEDRLGWKKANEAHAAVLLDVVRRHWREDLAPHLAAEPRGRRARHLYARLRAELVSDLERAIAGPLAEAIECQARFGPLLGIEKEAEVPPEAQTCWRLARSVEPAVVELLARRVEQHEVQHAIDDRDLEPPPEVSSRCQGDPSASPESVTAEVSAILAEIDRGPLPRLALAHAISLGSELGRTHRLAAEVILEVVNPDGEDVLALLRRPRAELSLRARLAYVQLFGREVARVTAP